MKTFRRLSIKQRMFVCMMMLSLVPQLILFTWMYNQNREKLVSVTRDNTYQLVRASNDVLNNQMRLISETTRNILIDEELYGLFSTQKKAVPDAELTYYTYSGLTETVTERLVRKTLFKYFGNYVSVEQADIVTRNKCYSMNSQTMDYTDFWDSALYERICNQNGGIEWIGSMDMRPFRLERDYLSCARLMNLTHVQQSGIGLPLTPNSEKPILLIMLNRSFMTEQLRKSIASLSGAQYTLLSADGEVLLLGGSLSMKFDAETLAQIKQKSTGMLETHDEAGHTMIVCFDRLEQSGWTSCAAFSVEALTGQMEREMRTMYAGVVTIQVLASLLATFLAIRMMTSRIHKVNAAVNEVKAGNYTVRIMDERKDEFTPLVDNINDMSLMLQKLIDENLNVRLGEQEAHLQTLMTQLNPHYIYNTLNVINWVALRENARHSGALIVALSRMLRYTTNNREALTCLKDDMAWMEQYLKLMQVRFEGLFTVQWEIAQDCMVLRLPKLFLQPLFENSILHGFANRTEGGVVQVHIWQEDSDVLCQVKDNGCGMETEHIEELLRGETGSVGLYNIHKRIELMFGVGYGISIQSEPGQGTCVTVRMRSQ